MLGGEIAQVTPVSIHAPREGERQNEVLFPKSVFQFQSTLPARGSDIRPFWRVNTGISFNPRSPRGGATQVRFLLVGRGLVSIHAPREGERPNQSTHTTKKWRFQSTLPARGSDKRTDAMNVSISVSIHAPREGERPLGCDSAERLGVSIHAPREGERRLALFCLSRCHSFQSTLPARGSDVIYETH